ncbi:12-(S)-hydroxy-5,8,10,14-eicosatetraenoic acid receptor-like [Alosa pseudoharengus]|uniref:12-(S)-hydroxy-5,8,10,14-eicosatetraenoic acid receptor-like n=1 Tax=Alosa pseudoharengus TaxID=34774 RepID=UPI003F8A7A62
MEVDPLVDNCTAQNKPLYVFYSTVLFGEFILALPLNASVIYLFIFKLKFWKTNASNIFLFNLVLADILLLFCLPVRAYNFQQGKRRSENEVVFRALLFILFLNRGASIVFLTVVSAYRYLKVVHAGRNCTREIHKHSPLIAGLIWLVLLPLTIPMMLRPLSKSLCSDEDNVVDVFREIVFFTENLVPFVILVLCTVGITARLRQNTVGDQTVLRRASFLVASVILVFSLCFLPCTISRMVLLVVSRGSEFSPEAKDVALQVYDGLKCLEYLELLLDPIVYCLSSTKFKSLYMETYLPFLLTKNKQDSSDNVPATRQAQALQEEPTEESDDV